MKSNFTKISNCILEKLATFPLSGEEIRIISVILRKTYGWSKKEDAISVSQFVKATGMDGRHIYRTIKRLKDREVIFVTRAGDTNVFKFNKHVVEWKGTPK